MFHLLKLLFDVNYYVGFIKNGGLPNQLSKEDEEKYIHMLDSDQKEEAREILIQHNIRLVAHIANKYENNDNIEDLISIGIIGLIKAVDTYSVSKGVKIATYAAKCIDNEILMYLRTNKKTNKDISLFSSVGQDKDGSEIALIDIIPNNEPSADQVLDRKYKINDLKKFLNILDARELEIIIHRFGLFDNVEKTQREIAKEFKISRSYISRIEKRALTKLLHEFKKNNNN